MYVQPAGKSLYAGEKNEDFMVPEGYSGNTFAVGKPMPPEAEEESFADSPMPKEASAEAETEEQNTLAETAEAIPAGNFLGKIPLLSSLLPPRRKNREGGNDLLMLGVLFLLLRDDGDNDLLPLLLLLLLWN
jgi:hypothetical protein